MNMRITILFGGSNRERLVSVASAQALHQALPEADLWWWDVEDRVHVVQSKQLLEHARPFEDEFKPGTSGIPLVQALDQAKAEDRVLVLGLHGGCAENGELQVMCEARGVPFTGSGSASSHLAFDKIAAKHFAALGGVTPPANIALDDIDAAFAEYGRLIAKPARDGSSYGLIFVNARQDLVAVRNAAKHEEYVIEPYIAGVEATCGVLERTDGSIVSLPPIEIIPGEGNFDYAAKYLLSTTQEICPGRFTPEITAALKQQAMLAHRAMSCTGYSRSDFIVSAKGARLSRNQHAPRVDQVLALPQGAEGRGHRVRRLPARPGRARRAGCTEIIRTG
ncbi:D-alanine-D-alanine ligase [Bradyrhizobium diazoefficiens]